MFALSMVNSGLAADANDRDLSAFGGSVRLCTPVEAPSLPESCRCCVEVAAAFEVGIKVEDSEKIGMLIVRSSLVRGDGWGTDTASTSTSASSCGASSGILVCLGRE